MFAQDRNELIVSVVSLWEIVTKQRVGKLQGDMAEIIEQLEPASKVKWLAV